MEQQGGPLAGAKPAGGKFQPMKQSAHVVAAGGAVAADLGVGEDKGNVRVRPIDLAQALEVAVEEIVVAVEQDHDLTARRRDSGAD
jgi:hypothetical protein